MDFENLNILIISMIYTLGDQVIKDFAVSRHWKNGKKT